MRSSVHGILKSRQGTWPIVATTLATLTGVFLRDQLYGDCDSARMHRVGYGMSATASSLMYLSPAAFIGLMSAPLSGWLAPRIGWRVLMWSGLSLCLLTLTAVSLLLAHPWAVCVAFALLGVFYNGFTLTAINGLGVILSPRDSPGSLPGLNGASFGIGCRARYRRRCSYRRCGEPIGAISWRCGSRLALRS